MIEVVTLLSGEVDAALIHSYASHTVSLLFFGFPKRSLELHHRHGRVICRTCNCLMYLNGSSVGKAENLLAEVGGIPLLKNPERNREFTEWIVNIPGIAFVFGPRKVRSARKIPMTCFFRPEHFVFEIQSAIGLHATICGIESRLDDNSRIRDGYQCSREGRNYGHGRCISSASSGGNRRNTRRMKGKYSFREYARVGFFDDSEPNGVIPSPGKYDRGRIAFRFLSRRSFESEIELAIEIRFYKTSGK